MPCTEEEKRSGWRNPVLWLMLALPLGTIAAGLWTLKIAAGESAVDSAPEPVKRTAQIQVSDLGADEAAAAMGLQAQLQWDSQGTQISLSVPEAPARLQLDFVHPTDARHDQRIELAWDNAGHWRGPPGPGTSTAWHVRLSPLGGHWRLVGRIAPGQTALVLQPAISAP